MHRTDLTSQAIDDVLAGTFPASDPPSWTPGMVRPAPEIVGRDSETGSGTDETNARERQNVTDVAERFLTLRG